MNAGSRSFADLTGKQALVTGASSGIGRAIATEFAQAGADVAIHYARSEDQAMKTLAEVESFGVKGSLLQGDFLSISPLEFGRQAWKQLGRIDMLVNNAGVDLLTGVGKTLSYEQKLKQLLEVDVAASVLVSKVVGGFMKEHGSGSIINIGWDQADRGMEGDSGELFSVAKSAVMGFTRSLAVSLAPKVRVNCIAPGWIQTAWGEQASPEWEARVLAETPLKRWGLPTDISRLARFLASDEASYLTGQVINSNGGAIR